MTNAEFMLRLEDALRGKLPPEELDEVMRYHREYFAEAGENAAAELDPPEVIARRILDEQEAKYQPPRKKLPGWSIPLIVIAVVVAVSVGTSVRSAVYYGIRNFLSRPILHIRTTTIKEVTQEDAVDWAWSTEEDSAITWDGAADHPSLTVHTDAFSAIQVSADVADVTVRAGNNYELSMDWYLEEEDFTFRIDEGVLTVTGTPAEDTVANRKGARITITIPDRLDKADVTVGIGNITLDLFTGDERSYVLDLYSGLGECKINDRKVGSDYHTDGGSYAIWAETGIGNIDLNF